MTAYSWEQLDKVARNSERRVSPSCFQLHNDCKWTPHLIPSPCQIGCFPNRFHSTQANPDLISSCQKESIEPKQSIQTTMTWKWWHVSFNVIMQIIQLRYTFASWSLTQINIASFLFVIINVSSFYLSCPPLDKTNSSPNWQ